MTEITLTQWNQFNAVRVSFTCECGQLTVATCPVNKSPSLGTTRTPPESVTGLCGHSAPADAAEALSYPMGAYERLAG